jgi:hypothetical protein
MGASVPSEAGKSPGFSPLYLVNVFMNVGLGSFPLENC